MAFDAKTAKQQGEKWLERIRASEKREETWINQAKKAEAIYLSEAKDGAQKYFFNILHSNVETIVPAIYSQTPKPDIRRRFGDRDPVGKAVSQVLERTILVQIDDGSLDPEIEGVSQSAFVSGRGVVRVRLLNEDIQTGETEDDLADAVEDTAEAEPNETDDETPDEQPEQMPGASIQRLSFEAVPWQDFRFGKAKRWPDVPWIAFKHVIDEETIEEWEKEDQVQAQMALSPKTGENQEDSKGDVEVWEIWCKRSKTVKFIREIDGLIYKETPDPLQLAGFFPVTRPVQPIEVVGKLCPVAPFEVYEDLALELDRVTKRIQKISEGIKVRGGAAAGETMAGIKDVAALGDNEIAELKGVEAFAQQGGLEKAIMWWPIEKAVAALQVLTDHRDRVKATIYEVTGISDIVRGASNADETATAQQIKSQWGSLRIQKMQRMLERCVREIFVMAAELIATKFTVETMQAASGIEITPEMQALLTSDVTRHYRIDVETDSTIKADLTKSKAEMTQFLGGTAQYAQAIGPLVQQGAMNPVLAIEIYSAFARVFRLGKTVEDSLEQLGLDAQQKASQPPQPPPPDPKVEQMKAELEMRGKEHEQTMAHKQQSHELDMALQQQKLAADQNSAAVKSDQQQQQFAMKTDQQAQAFEAKQEQAAQQPAPQPNQSETVTPDMLMQFAQVIAGAIEQGNKQVIASLTGQQTGLN